MATSTTVSLPFHRLGEGWVGRQGPARAHARPDPGISLPLSGPARHRGLVAYPFASAIVMTFQAKTAGAPGRFIVWTTTGSSWVASNSCARSSTRLSYTAGGASG